MKDSIDTFAYMMAAEKVVAMISVIEQNLEFFGEYKIKPDDEVKKVMIPLLEQMRKWLNEPIQ